MLYYEPFWDCTVWLFGTQQLELLEWEGVYNTVRPHQALGYVTPLKFLEQQKEYQERRMCH